MTSPGLDIDIDAAVGLKPEPQQPTTQALEQATDLVVQSGPTALVCKDLLNERSLEAAKAYARQILPTLVADPNQLAKLGNEAVEEVNALASRMLEEAGREANMPELVAITNELDDKIRGFTGRWEGRRLQVQDARGDYDKLRGRVLDFFMKFRDMFAMLLKDAQTLSNWLDSLEAKIVEQQHRLARNVELCNQLLESNEDAISRLVGAIAIMEVLRDEAAAQVDAITVDAADTSPAAREQREQRDQLTTMIQQLDVRTSEFKQRLFVAWATSPQVRNIRTISYSLGQRLGLLNTLTIPVFKLTVVQWVAVMQADRASQMGEAVADTNERALGAFARATNEVMPRVAKAVQEPSMSPESILLIADSLQTQARGFAEAYKHGIRERARVEAAIMKGAQSIALSSDQQAATIRDLISAAHDPVQLPAPDVLPELVTGHAKEAGVRTEPAVSSPTA